jgi:hypothetical protein
LHNKLTFDKWQPINQEEILCKQTTAGIAAFSLPALLSAQKITESGKKKLYAWWTS